MPKIIENDSYENFAYKVGTGEISNQKIIDVINKQQLEETVRKMNLVDEKVEESIEHNPASSVLIMGEDNIEKKIYSELDKIG